jgi:hypothetical protein
VIQDLSRHMPQGTERNNKNTFVRMTVIPGYYRTYHLLNISLYHYRCINSLDNLPLIMRYTPPAQINTKIDSVNRDLPIHTVRGTRMRSWLRH